MLAARQEIIALGLGEAESHVENGDPARAIALLETLERLNVHDEPLRWLKEVARRLESARHLALRGKFVEAESLAKAADAIRPKLDYVHAKVREYHERIEPFRQLTESLHRAMADEQWTEVVSLADQALEMAPESRLAQNLRSKAWAKVGTPVGDSQRALGTDARLERGRASGCWPPTRTSELAPGVSAGRTACRAAVPAVDRRRGRLPGVPG